MSAMTRFLVSFFLLVSASTASLAADKTIIILDASGSMWGQIDGRPKLEIAREALRGVLAKLPADREIGFMAYGHRQKGSCDDIELIVPPAPGTAAAIASAADGLKFLGKTPLSAAVKQAAEALKYTEDKATVILITDGLETCDADPCALGKELEQSGVDFTAHVVGFGLTADEGRQVACLAENTGGKYIQADDSAGLNDALAETVVAAPEPEPAPAPPPAPAPEPAPAPMPAAPVFNFIPKVVLAQGGVPLADAGNAYEIYRIAADGAKGERITTEYGNYQGNLEPGDYVVRANLDFAVAEQKVTIEAGKLNETVFVLNGATLILSPRPSPGADIDDSAAVFIEYPGGSTTYYGRAKVVVPAGDSKVTATIGKGSISETITLAAGQTVEKDLVVGVGRAVVNAFYTAGGDKVDASGMFTQIFKAAKKIDGSREELSNNYGPDAKYDLPAGDYVAVATMDKASAEQPFAVKTGEAVDVAIPLNAGVLSITATGAKFIEVFSAKKDIQGERKPFGNAYAETHQTTLPAGDYAIVADREAASGKTEATATVKAGERTEVTVP